jgi:hypothetical protein
MSQLDNILQTIKSYTQLPPNYDGEGTLNPSPLSIVTAYNFVKILSYNYGSRLYPDSTLNANGTVSLYWQNDNIYAEVEFFESSKVVYFIKKNTIIKGALFNASIDTMINTIMHQIK